MTLPSIRETALDGVLLIEPVRHADQRGFFSETYNAEALAECGVSETFVQDNQSVSANKTTLRGLHFQAPPYGQTKLVRCGRGAVWDVAVDFRKGSRSFGQWTAHELSAENGLQMLIPEGFLHGFLTLTPDCEVLYKCSKSFKPSHDRAVAWNSCGIDWPLADATPVLSEKDMTAPRFADTVSPFELNP